MQRSRSLRSEGAEGVYNTAKSLVQSRFPGVGKIICLSWPRFKGSFIQRRFTNGKLENRTFVSCKEGGLPFSTWEFNPSKKQSDFADFYETDPILARARFECDPPFARDAYIKDSLPILRAFDADIDEDEPRVLILGQCHAEEILGVEISMYNGQFFSLINFNI